MTAQEWLDKEQWREISDEELLVLIGQVLRDGRAQGMTEAAEIADTIRNPPFQFANDHSVSVNIRHARDRRP